MARLSGGTPAIDSGEVLRFFEERAASACVADQYAVTSFSERESAEQRHLAERALALPLLGLPHAGATILDIGCGGGRWARSLMADVAPRAASYLGIDFSPALIRLARAQELGPQASFVEMSAEAFAGGAALKCVPLSHVLMVAVTMYINDNTVLGVLTRAAQLLRPGGLLYLREAAATGTERLTLIKEPSAALGDRYTAVYRTENECKSLVAAAGLDVLSSGNLPASHFQRHHETRHQYFICSRR